MLNHDDNGFVVCSIDVNIYYMYFYYIKNHTRFVYFSKFDYLCIYLFLYVSTLGCRLKI